MSAKLWMPILEELYGAEFATLLSGEIQKRVAAAQAAMRARPAALSERDTWLITYADQFQEPGHAALQVLHDFLDQHTTPWITGVHVLPFYPWSSDDGFSITNYLAVDPAYGEWSDIKNLAAGRHLMADAVINHMSAQSTWFRGFIDGDPEYEDFFVTADPASDLSATVRPRTTPLLTRFESATGDRWVWTTFSADQVDLNYRNPAVLLRIIDVLLEYSRRGATAIRLDAVGFLWKEPGTSSIHLPQTHAVVHLLRLVLDAAAPGSVLVTETNVPHSENVSYFGTAERPEAQLVYQFPLAPLVLDALATGDASVLASWAASLDTPVPATSFLNFLASHDGVGLRPTEDLIPARRIEALADLSRRAGGGVGERSRSDGTIVPYELNSTWFDLVAVGYNEQEAISRHLAAHDVMFALAGVPLIYVHSLFGSSNDQAGFAATGRLRSYNRHKFTDVQRLQGGIADPGSRVGRIYAGIRDMASARAAHPAFHPFADQEILPARPALLVIKRTNDAAQALVVINLSSSTVQYDLPRGIWETLVPRAPAPKKLNVAGWKSIWLSRK